MALTSLEERIIKTLAYYRAMGVSCMSASEIKKHLINDESIAKDTLFFDIYTALEHLQKEGLLREKYGFWGLCASKEVGAEKRINNLKHTALKWKVFKNTASFLPYMPYVRSVSVTGSMALLNSTEQSDIDILLENEEGKIWTTRFVVTVVSFLLGSRKRPKKRAGKLCFSQHISKNAVAFGPPPIHNTVNNMRTIVWEDGENAQNKALLHLKPRRILLMLKRAIEVFLDATGLGNLAERLFAKMQITKIDNNPTKYPAQLPPLGLNSKNLIFYYPKVEGTEKKYRELLAELKVQ